MFQGKLVKVNLITHFMLSNFFPEKFSRNRQATGDNTVWHCAVLMPDV
jgi:hypothetical protein